MAIRLPELFFSGLFFILAGCTPGGNTPTNQVSAVGETPTTLGQTFFRDKYADCLSGCSGAFQSPSSPRCDGTVYSTNSPTIGGGGGGYPVGLLPESYVPGAIPLALIPPQGGSCITVGEPCNETGNPECDEIRKEISENHENFGKAYLAALPELQKAFDAANQNFQSSIAAAQQSLYASAAYDSYLDTYRDAYNAKCTFTPFPPPSAPPNPYAQPHDKICCSSWPFQCTPK